MIFSNTLWREVSNSNFFFKFQKFFARKFKIDIFSRIVFLVDLLCHHLLMPSSRLFLWASWDASSWTGLEWNPGFFPYTHSSHVGFSRGQEMSDDSLIEHLVDVIRSGAGVDHRRFSHRPIRRSAELRDRNINDHKNRQQ